MAALFPQVNKFKSKFGGPLVVHGRLGMGRTGCFMVMDTEMERFNNERTLQIRQSKVPASKASPLNRRADLGEGGLPCCLSAVEALRWCRPGMVETREQYHFLHGALVEYATSKVRECNPLGRWSGWVAPPCKFSRWLPFPFSSSSSSSSSLFCCVGRRELAWLPSAHRVARRLLRQLAQLPGL